MLCIFDPETSPGATGILAQDWSILRLASQASCTQIAWYLIAAAIVSANLARRLKARQKCKLAKSHADGF